jgi:TPR repeat protein
MVNLASLILTRKTMMNEDESPSDLVHRAAEMGQPVAMRLYGQMLLLEEPTQRDGIGWLYRAAGKREVIAMVELAICLQRGLGGSRDLEQAAVWLQRAADLGSVDAKQRLVAVYEQGLGTPSDPARAKKIKQELEAGQ